MVPHNCVQSKLLQQVLSMWEDTFTGVFRFHVRWLVHSSGLPEDAFARLQAARRAFSDEKEADHGSGKHKADKGDNDESATKAEPPSPAQAADKMDGDGDGDEVFLTTKTDDIDVRIVVKPAVVSVALKASTIPAFFKDKGKLGPRLSHFFEASSGDFIPVEHTHSVMKRARARQAEAVARASKLTEKSAAAKGGKPLAQSNGWLMPKRRSGAAAAPGDTAAATSVRDSNSEVGSNEGGNNEPEPEAEPAKSDDMEWDIERDNDDSDSTDMDYQQPSDVPPRKSARRKKPLVFDDDDYHDQEEGEEGEGEGVKRAGSRGPSPPPHVVDGAATPPFRSTPLALIKPDQSVRKRPRRLAMPPAEGDPVSPTVHAEGSSAGDTDGRPARTRKASAEARGRITPPRAVFSQETEDPALPNRRPSIAGKRKRGRPTKAAAAAAAAAAAGEVEEADFPPRRTPVGDDHQVAIPDLLSLAARKEEAVPPPKGADAKNVAKMVRVAEKFAGRYAVFWCISELLSFGLPEWTYGARRARYWFGSEKLSWTIPYTS